MQNEEGSVSQPAAAEELRLGTSPRRLDLAAVSQGVRKECPFREGLFVMILPAATYNPRYRKAVQNARAKDDGDFTDRYEDAEFVVDALVADMDGLYNAAGERVPYTRERGLKILSSPNHADVRVWITNEAHQYGEFYTEQVEKDAGNS
jgi:hypothetical protein